AAVAPAVVPSTAAGGMSTVAVAWLSLAGGSAAAAGAAVRIMITSRKNAFAMRPQEISGTSICAPSVAAYATSLLFEAPDVHGRAMDARWNFQARRRTQLLLRAEHLWVARQGIGGPVHPRHLA